MTLQQLLEKVENIEKYLSGKSVKEQYEFEIKLITELLKYEDKLLEPFSEYLERGPGLARRLFLEVAKRSENEKFISKMIDFLRKNRESMDLFGDEVADLFPLIGGSAKAREAVKEDFKNKLYNGLLVEASSDNSKEFFDFVEKTIEDVIENYEKYEEWFYINHFAQFLSKKRKKTKELYKKLLELNLNREEKITIKEFLEKKLYNELEKSLDKVLINLEMQGTILSPAGNLVLIGERPIINDSNLKEYSPLLYSIEEIICNHYKKNPGLRDGDVLKMLKNVRDNIWKKDFTGETEFEKFFIHSFKFALYKYIGLYYTNGEVSACLSYILNSVKRHRDFEEGYLEFIKKQFEEEEKEDSAILRPKTLLQ